MANSVEDLILGGSSARGADSGGSSSFFDPASIRCWAHSNHRRTNRGDLMFTLIIAAIVFAALMLAFSQGIKK
jgi:hypothetical protein